MRAWRLISGAVPVGGRVVRAGWGASPCRGATTVTPHARYFALHAWLASRATTKVSPLTTLGTVAAVRGGARATGAMLSTPRAQRLAETATDPHWFPLGRPRPAGQPRRVPEVVPASATAGPTCPPTAGHTSSTGSDPTPTSPPSPPSPPQAPTPAAASGFYSISSLTHPTLKENDQSQSRSATTVLLSEGCYALAGTRRDRHRRNRERRKGTMSSNLQRDTRAPRDSPLRHGRSRLAYSLRCCRSASI